MVKLRDINGNIATPLCMTVKDLQKEIRKVPNYLSKTIDEVLDDLKEIQTRDEIARAEALRIANPNGRIVKIDDIHNPYQNPYRFGPNSELPKTNKLYMVFIQRRDDTREQVPLPPMPVEISGKRGRKKAIPEIPDSEDIEELRRYIMARFKPVLGNASEVAKFKSELKDFISRHATPKTAQYIYSHLNIREVEVKNDVDFHLYYVMKNRYINFGDYVIQKFCTEAPSYINSVQNREFGCFFRCCISQTPIVFRASKSLKKLAYMDTGDGRITLSTGIEEIAREFNLNVTVLDIELNSIFHHWFAENRKNRSVVVIVKDNHAYSLNTNLKGSVSKSGAHMLIQRGLRELTVKGIPEDLKNRKLPICGFIKINFDEPLSPISNEDSVAGAGDLDESFTFDHSSSSNSEEIIAIHYFLFSDNDSIENPRITPDKFLPDTDYIFYVNEDSTFSKALCMHKLYLYFYHKMGISGNVIDSGKTSDNIQLKICYPNGAKLYFRSRDDYLYDSMYPADYTYSITTLSKYLFLTQLETPLPKVIDPILHAAFKGLCRPFKNVKYGNFEGKVYYFDLEKAYYACSSDLWIPQTTIDWTPGVGPREDAALYLILSSSDTNNNDEDKDGLWTMHIDPNQSYDAIVPIQSRTNIVREYGDWLKTNFPDNYKMFFNSLIGRMHPTDSTQSNTIYFHNDTDFSNFIRMREGKRIIDVQRDETDGGMWKLRFTYDSGFYSGFSLPYFPAQIIQRCTAKVVALRKKLEALGCELIMTMTDSCICLAPESLTSEFIKEQALEGWSLKVNEGTRIHVPQVGQYRIWKDDQIVGGTKLYEKYLRSRRPITILKKDGRRVILNPSPSPVKTCLDNDVIDTVKVEKILARTNPHTHLLVSGSAGVGKSRWIRQNYWDTNSGNSVTIGTTGVSSNSISTRTLHSTFSIIIGHAKDVCSIIRHMGADTVLKLQKMETLVIDEAFMAREDDMILIDQILRLLNNSPAYFGGKKLVMVGDERQLGPVQSAPFIGSSLYQKLQIQSITIPYDENESRMKYHFKQWTDYFRTVRTGLEISHYISASFDKFSKEKIPEAITCFFTNAEVDSWNKIMHDSIYPDKPSVIVNGEPLILRKNIDVRKGLFNGRLGTAEWIGEDLYFKYTVKNARPIKDDDNSDVDEDDDGDIICSNIIDELSPDALRKMDESYDYVTKTQSLKSLSLGDDYNLAYAITIHKSQSLTLEEGINLGIMNLLSNKKRPLDNDFITRLLYVGVSRVRDFDKIHFF